MEQSLNERNIRRSQLEASIREAKRDRVFNPLISGVKIIPDALFLAGGIYLGVITDETFGTGHYATALFGLLGSISAGISATRYADRKGGTRLGYFADDVHNFFNNKDLKRYKRELREVNNSLQQF